MKRAELVKGQLVRLRKSWRNYGIVLETEAYVEDGYYGYYRREGSRFRPAQKGRYGDGFQGVLVATTGLSDWALERAIEDPNSNIQWSPEVVQLRQIDQAVEGDLIAYLKTRARNRREAEAAAKRQTESRVAKVKVEKKAVDQTIAILKRFGISQGYGPGQYNAHQPSLQDGRGKWAFVFGLDAFLKLGNVLADYVEDTTSEMGQEARSA